MIGQRTFHKLVALALLIPLLTSAATAAPRVIIVSLDGATPRLVDEYTAAGEMNPLTGLGRLRTHGLAAKQNVTVSPSLAERPGQHVLEDGEAVHEVELLEHHPDDAP